MRLVIQRVSHARVEIDNSEEVVGEISSGLFVLVGIGRDDDYDVSEKLANKLSKLRVMADDKGKMNKTVSEVNGSILVVSQFTLYADVSDGNRPSFISAALPEAAQKIYEHFVKSLRDKGMNVETGTFGKYMEINAALDGPVTILLKS